MHQEENPEGDASLIFPAINEAARERFHCSYFIMGFLTFRRQSVLFSLEKVQLIDSEYPFLTRLWFLEQF